MKRYLWHKSAIYNLATVCLGGALPCVDFMDVIMGGGGGGSVVAALKELL